jgi:hypothetical protein
MVHLHVRHDPEHEERRTLRKLRLLRIALGDALALAECCDGAIALRLRYAIEDAGDAIRREEDACRTRT